MVPVRLNTNGVTAFVTIMRGCDNMCAFCVVPFTRGRERSRDPYSIVAECRDLVAKGYKEVTLLGQNVDSYKYTSPQPLSRGEGLLTASSSTPSPETSPQPLSQGEGLLTTSSPTPSPAEKGLNAPPLSSGEGPRVRVDFADLLEMVALACPSLRIRYSTSHPKDMTDKVLVVMAKYDNICKYIHLPVQSGSSAVLKRMNRGYDREWYMERMESIRRHMPDCAISTDIIVGFSGETEEDHLETLSIMKEVGYDMAFMFKYSERPKTLAARKYPDDVPEEVKGRRLTEIIDNQKRNSSKRMASYVGQTHQVLLEGVSRRSEQHLFGRNSQNSIVLIPRHHEGGELKPGMFVMAHIVNSTAGNLHAEFISFCEEALISA